MKNGKRHAWRTYTVVASAALIAPAQDLAYAQASTPPASSAGDGAGVLGGADGLIWPGLLVLGAAGLGLGLGGGSGGSSSHSGGSNTTGGSTATQNQTTTDQSPLPPGPAAGNSVAGNSSGTSP